MKAIVTGGLGFIGNELTRQLIKNGCEVHNIDCMSYAANINNVSDFVDNPLYNYYKINLTDKKYVEAVLDYVSNIDVIFHLAAHSHVDNSISGPEIFLENVVGTFTLLEAWRNRINKFNNSKFVYMSTDEVMGDLPIGSNDKFTVSSPLNPSSPYSASKASGEVMCRSYRRTYDLPITCVRSSNAYGPRQHLEKLIPKTIFNALNNKQIPVYGKGINVRDWIFVKDLANAIIFIGSGGKSSGYSLDMPPVVNVGSSNEISNLELVSMILDILHVDNSLITFVKDRLGHDLRYAIDTTELASLGWQASTSLRHGIMQTINWYADNKEWCDGVHKN